MYEQYAHTIANEVRFLGHDMDDKGSDTNAFAEFILSRCAKSDFVETLDEIGVQDRLGRRTQGDSPANSMVHQSLKIRLHLRPVIVNDAK